MACDGYTKVWELAAGELVKLDGARGTTLRVTRGTIWLTMQDDTRDVVLAAGDVFTIDRGGLTIVEAQTKTHVCVLGRATAEERVLPAIADWQPRAPAWLGALNAARRFVPYL